MICPDCNDIKHDGKCKWPIVVYDDVWCKITIEKDPYGYRGLGYFVVLDDDPENSVHAIKLDEAYETADMMRDEFIAENGQFGVGA